MVARLADTLDMPLRDRNALLLAAGYAPEYPERSLSTPDLAQVRHAIDLILGAQEPFPAFVMNRRWDVLYANQAAARVGSFLIGGSAHSNMVRQFFDPNDMRAVVVNWEEVGGDLIRHLHDEIAATPSDTKAAALLDEALRYPGVPVAWRTRQLGSVPTPLLTVHFRKGNRDLRFFSTITRFATPNDVTIDELRIECAFPADDITAELCRRLARETGNAERA